MKKTKDKKLIAFIMSFVLVSISLTVYAGNESDKRTENSKHYVVDGTDSIFENYVALPSSYNNQSVSGQVVSAKTLSSSKAEVPRNLDISYREKEIKLTWDKAQYASSYNIYRSTGKYSTYEKVGIANTNSYTETVTGSVYDYYYKITAVNADELESDMSEVMAMDIKLFGDTINLFSPTDDVNQINSLIKAISDVQMPASKSEFTDNRYAIAFKPGNYNIDTVNVGFYTQVLGLGQTPYDVTIKNINVDSAANGNVLINFWRGIENLSVDTGNAATEVKWGASQAAPIRRLYVNGKLHLDDIGLPASGGFLADTNVTGQTGSWSQQQFMIRNTHMTNGWYDGVWNMLFVGCENAPAATANWGSSSYKSYTTVENTPRIKEKPFLYLDDNGEYQVFVPGVRTDAKGVSWSQDNIGTGISIPIANFYIAKAGADTADTINEALAEGKYVIFTPGIYRLDKAIDVENENTVLLGLGLATIICNNTDTAIKVADKGGITIAGLIIEAGANESDTLIKVGAEKNDVDHCENPILLSDVFCRVGGARIGKTDKCVEINSNDVIGDHFWIWRADHGAGANWTESTANNGVVVNGDDVTIYGLFVEHFQQYQTIWNGENGKTFFYQSELPYDVPYQSDWMSNNGTVKGYASYKVADNVGKHDAMALGIYEVFIYTQEYVKLENAMEVSDGTKVTNACIVSLGNVNGEIGHIVNGQGGSVGSGGISGQGVKVGIDSYYNNAQFLKAELSQLIENYKDIQKENATDATWQAFNEALSNAKTLVEKEDITATELSKAKNGLEDSYNALVNSKKEEEPAVVSNKKGVSSWYYASENASQRDLSMLNKVGATWTYNWGNTQEAAEEAKAIGMEYVPMAWGPWSVNDTEIAKLKAGKESGIYEHLLAFNEPDLTEQSNMTVDQAIELWPRLMETGLRLGSPAGAAVESTWVEEFMAKAKEKGYRVDFLTLHVYQDFTHPGSVESFRQALERLYAKYQIPIWITELGCIDVEPLWGGYTRYDELSHEASTKYIKEVTDMLESLDYVERYAWFVDSSSNVTGTDYTRLFDTTTDELTEEGLVYKMAGEKPSIDGETTTVPTIPQETTTKSPDVTTPSESENSTTTLKQEETITKTGTSAEKLALVTKFKRPGRAKVIKAKLVKRKSLIIKLKKVKLAKSYKVQISTTKKFKKKRTINRFTKKHRLKIKNLNKAKKLKKVKMYYFVRVKAYRVVNEKKIYSKKWSKIKKVKVINK